MSAVKKITGLFERVRAPLSKISTPSSGPKDADLVTAVIQRIEAEGEDLIPDATATDPEAVYRRLMKRLEWQLKNSGITVEELVRTYPREVWSVVVFKAYEGTKKKRKLEFNFKEKLAGAGFRPIQAGAWILPPNKTPSGLESQDTIRVWFRQQLVKPAPKSVDFVFPFIALMDLKKVASERRGIRKMPTARTLFSVLSVEEVAPPSHLYSAMKAKGYGVRDIILAGDISFLASAFADKEDMEGIHENELEIGAKLRHATGAKKIDLEDLANLGPETIAKAFGSWVAHPKDFAQRLIVEAQFWMRVMGGTVPT